MDKKKVMQKNVTSKNVAVKKEGGILKFGYSKEMFELIVRIYCKGADMDSIAMYFNIIKRLKLDPFANQVYLVTRKVKQADGSYKNESRPLISIDGYRAIAERTKQLAGVDDAIFDDGYKYEPGKEPKNPSKATITIYRMVKGQRVGFTASARWKEYFPGEKQGFMWNKMPYNQLAKCAEALALRKAFPQDLSGLFVDAEMDQAGAVEVEVVNAPVIDKPKDEPIVEKFICEMCDVEVSKAEAQYSTKMYGKILCREDQKSYKK
ncbi:MAG TPA: phage recombination protein Bet [Bacilli bacterium]|nr:phage recombination protein Bet [Bacilli bacterium]